MLIEVLAQAGDRLAATRAYEQCRITLRAELGLEPSPEIEEALKRAVSATLPVADVARGTRPISDAASGRSKPGFATYSVLVVEDHDFQRRTALALLRRLGVAELHEASDGRAALEVSEMSHHRPT